MNNSNKKEDNLDNIYQQTDPLSTIGPVLEEDLKKYLIKVPLNISDLKEIKCSDDTQSQYYLCECNKGKGVQMICKNCAEKCHKGHYQKLIPNDAIIRKCYCGEKFHAPQKIKEDNKNKTKKSNCLFKVLLEVASGNGVFTLTHKDTEETINLCEICINHCLENVNEYLIKRTKYAECQCEKHFSNMNEFSYNIELTKIEDLHFYMRNLNINIFLKIQKMQQIFIKQLISRIQRYKFYPTEENNTQFYLQTNNFSVLEVISAFCSTWKNKYNFLLPVFDVFDKETLFSLLEDKHNYIKNKINKNKKAHFIQYYTGMFYFAEILFNSIIKPKIIRHNNLFNIRTVLEMSIGERFLYMIQAKYFYKFMDDINDYTKSEEQLYKDIISQFSEKIITLFKSMIKVMDDNEWCLPIQAFCTMNRISKYFIKYNLFTVLQINSYFDAVDLALNNITKSKNLIDLSTNDLPPTQGSLNFNSNFEQLYKTKDADDGIFNQSYSLQPNQIGKTTLHILKSILYSILYNNDRISLAHLKKNNKYLRTKFSFIEPDTIGQEIKDYVNQYLLAKVFLKSFRYFDKNKNIKKTMMYDFCVQKILEIFVHYKDFYYYSLKKFDWNYDLYLINEADKYSSEDKKMYFPRIEQIIDIDQKNLETFNKIISYFCIELGQQNEKYLTYQINIQAYEENSSRLIEEFINESMRLFEKKNVSEDGIDTVLNVNYKYMILKTNIFQVIDQYILIFSKFHQFQNELNEESKKNMIFRKLLSFISNICRNDINLTLLFSNLNPTNFIYTFIDYDIDLDHNLSKNSNLSTIFTYLNNISNTYMNNQDKISFNSFYFFVECIRQLIILFGKNKYILPLILDLMIGKIYFIFKNSHEFGSVLNLISDVICNYKKIRDKYIEICNNNEKRNRNSTFSVSKINNFSDDEDIKENYKKENDINCQIDVKEINDINVKSIIGKAVSFNLGNKASKFLSEKRPYLINVNSNDYTINEEDQLFLEKLFLFESEIYISNLEHFGFYREKNIQLIKTNEIKDIIDYILKDNEISEEEFDDYTYDEQENDNDNIYNTDNPLNTRRHKRGVVKYSPSFKYSLFRYYIFKKISYKFSDNNLNSALYQMFNSDNSNINVFNICKHFYIQPNSKEEMIKIKDELISFLNTLRLIIEEENQETTQFFEYIIVRPLYFVLNFLSSIYDYLNGKDKYEIYHIIYIFYYLCDKILSNDSFSLSPSPYCIIKISDDAKKVISEELNRFSKISRENKDTAFFEYEKSENKLTTDKDNSNNNTTKVDEFLVYDKIAYFEFDKIYESFMHTLFHYLIKTREEEKDDNDNNKLNLSEIYLKQWDEKGENELVIINALNHLDNVISIQTKNNEDKKIILEEEPLKQVIKKTLTEYLLSKIIYDLNENALNSINIYNGIISNEKVMRDAYDNKLINLNNNKLDSCILGEHFTNKNMSLFSILNFLIENDIKGFQEQFDECFKDKSLKFKSKMFTFYIKTLIFKPMLVEVMKKYNIDNLNTSHQIIKRQKDYYYWLTKLGLKFIQNLCEGHNKQQQNYFWNLRLNFEENDCKIKMDLTEIEDINKTDEESFKYSFINFLYNCLYLIFNSIFPNSINTLNIFSKQGDQYMKEYKNCENLIIIYEKIHDLILEMLQGTEKENVQYLFNKAKDDISIWSMDNIDENKKQKIFSTFKFIKYSNFISKLLFSLNHEGTVDNNEAIYFSLNDYNINLKSLKYSAIYHQFIYINNFLDQGDEKDKTIIQPIVVFLESILNSEHILHAITYIIENYILKKDLLEFFSGNKKLMENEANKFKIYLTNLYYKTYKDDDLNIKKYFDLICELYKTIIILKERYYLLSLKKPKIALEHKYCIKELMNDNNFSFENIQEKIEKNKLKYALVCYFFSEIVKKVEFRISENDGDKNEVKLKTIYFTSTYKIYGSSITQFEEEVDRKSSSSKLTGLYSKLDYFKKEAQKAEEGISKDVIKINFWYSLILNIMLFFIYAKSNTQIVQNSYIYYTYFIMVCIQCLFNFYQIFFIYVCKSHRWGLYYELKSEELEMLYQQRIKNDSYYINFKKHYLFEKFKKILDKLYIFLSASFNLEIRQIIMIFCLDIIIIISYFKWYKLQVFCTISLLFSVISLVDTLWDIIQAFINAGTQLISMLFFLIILVYISSSFAFYAYSYEFVKDISPIKRINYCESLFECFIVFFNHGVRAGGGIGDFLENKTFENYWLYGFRFTVDIIFYIIIVLLLLNMLSGIIINTFTDIREDTEEKNYDKENKCFICNVEKKEFDKKKIDFQEHVNQEHYLNNYISYFIRLSQIDKNDMNADENIIDNALQTGNTSVFPVGLINEN